MTVTCAMGYELLILLVPSLQKDDSLRLDRPLLKDIPKLPFIPQITNFVYFLMILLVEVHTLWSWLYLVVCGTKSTTISNTFNHEH